MVYKYKTFDDFVDEHRQKLISDEEFLMQLERHLDERSSKQSNED